MIYRDFLWLILWVVIVLFNGASLFLHKFVSFSFFLYELDQAWLSVVNCCHFSKQCLLRLRSSQIKLFQLLLSLLLLVFYMLPSVEAEVIHVFILLRAGVRPGRVWYVQTFMRIVLRKDGLWRLWLQDWWVSRFGFIDLKSLMGSWGS